MAVGKILRKSLAKDLEISGQEIISGTYQENISRFQTTAVINVENPDTKVKLDNPSSLPEGVGLGTSFLQNDPYLAVAHSRSPFLSIYKQDEDVFTKLPQPDVAPSSGFTQTHILQVRIKESGKAFSNIAKDIVETVYDPNDPGFIFL
jgi:hypothetical protein